ncbi:lipase 3-like [Microplitis demolitor]|uniref:lipase 3-like n=1 Tax=Microplitis demolitor TaxID=69319 RepID=UPI0006D5143A|nr:lipase 3-like [Microplitis demolitor]
MAPEEILKRAQEMNCAVITARAGNVSVSVSVSDSKVVNKLKTFIDLVEESGYVGEEHEVKTEDGYELIVHRISGGPLNPVRFGKPVILLLHGLMGASDVWVLRGPAQDIAYLLVDQDYDVWAINVRGNYYSTLHMNITSNSTYWNFSWHENGMYDVPATINYILSLTNQKKLSLIGHSMGGTEILVLLSTRPEFNNKVNIAITWAPAATVTHDIPGFFPNFVFQHANEVTSSILRIKDHYPQGTSLKTILHYGQVFASRRFQQYDYGKMINLIKYNDIKPPEYLLSRITTPVIIYYARDDRLVTKEDVNLLLTKIPTAIAKEVPSDDFGHLGFIISKNTKSLIYDRG